MNPSADLDSFVQIAGEKCLGVIGKCYLKARRKEQVLRGKLICQLGKVEDIAVILCILPGQLLFGPPFKVSHPFWLTLRDNSNRRDVCLKPLGQIFVKKVQVTSYFLLP